MEKRQFIFIFLSCALFFATSIADSQSPESQPALRQGASPSSSIPIATNLKVLSKDTSAVDLYRLMSRFQTDLGVRCGYCHEEDPQTKRIDYASDENPKKETARLMIRMTGDLNTKYLAQLGDRRYADPLTCGNCHQGQSKPAVFEGK
jgi:hypothetical protein